MHKYRHKLNDKHIIWTDTHICIYVPTYLGHVEVVEAHGEKHTFRELLLALALFK